METNTSQIDHIANTKGLENINNMVGAWLEQQSICKTRSWIIRKPDHSPVLQALMWTGVDGAFSGGGDTGRRHFGGITNSATMKGWEPVGETNKHTYQVNTAIALSFADSLTQLQRSVRICAQDIPYTTASMRNNMRHDGTFTEQCRRTRQQLKARVPRRRLPGEVSRQGVE